MTKTHPTVLRYSMVTILIGAILAFLNVTQFAQSQPQLPPPTQHVSDFARVLDIAAKDRLETILQNLKLRSKIDFYIAVVESTGGQDLADFSGQLALQWKVGAFTGAGRSLLLVISVASKESFTRFSRMVQRDLPEGVLGTMTQRMRVPLAVGDFSTALNDGIQVFVDAVSSKIGFSVEDLDKPVSAMVTADAAPSERPDSSVATTKRQSTRPRTVTEPTPTPPPPEDATVVPVSDSKIAAAPVETTEQKPKAKPAPARASATKSSGSSLNAKRSTTPVDDEDEAEEVELTLTLPLAKRAVKLKEFLETHPNSKARPRAKELLISTHAGLGDQKLKNGDPAGADELLSAIDEADTSISDQLFTGVIAQIPMNLYLRSEHAAAFKAAQAIETKYATDAKRLVPVAAFYLTIERGDEAVRIADQAVTLAPELAEAHRVKAMGLHLSLRLDEATNEYKRVLELDPNSKSARVSLADLSRSTGKTEEALALYDELLKVDPKDRAVRTGHVLALLELNRKDEALSALEAAEADDSRNLQLLTGAAYWFAAHDNPDKAFELATKAVNIEPRYTWSQIALARSLIALKRPLEGERAIRYARQYGKFPTLNYELANVLASMGFYDEAVDVLRESFAIADNQIETRLAGRFTSRSENFLELLGPERRASLYQNTSADSAANAKMLKDLLVFSNLIGPRSDDQKLDESQVVAAAREFGSGSDNMRAFRQMYAASRLLRVGVGFQAAFELAEEAKKSSTSGMETAALTLAVQADEYRQMRAGAIAAGTVPDVAAAPRNVLENILRGRAEDLMGWALFNQEKYSEALDYLKRAAELLPSGTPAWRAATWHLAVVQEQAGSNNEALDNYIRSYKAGDPDPVRRVTIERLYQKVNGSLDGLSEKIGQGAIAETPATSQPQASPSTETAPDKPTAAPETAASTESGSPSPSPEKTPQPESSPAETPKRPESESPTTPASDTSPSPTPAQPAATSPSPTPSEPPASSPGASDEAMRAASARLRSIVKITGRVLDANNAGIGNVVVVLISPSGSVIASTTDTNGKYSFTVAASEKTYRLIPSKEGYTFSPIDKTFTGLYDNQKEIDFVGAASRPQY